MLDSALDALACPGCHEPFEPDAGALRCVACGRAYRAAGGIWDFAPEVELAAGLAQRFMEAPAITAIYERWFRPTVTRLVSSLTYADEERYLARWFTPVEGAVLDLACGTGRYSRWLGARTADRRILGLDLSRPMLAEARRRATGEGRTELSFVRGSALALPIASERLGAASSFGALHLFPRPEVAIAEVARTLRSGGSFTCLTVAAPTARAALAVQRAFSQVATLRFFELDELERWLDDAGLEPLDFTRRGAMLLFAARKR